MKNVNKKTVILTTAVCLLPILAGVLVYDQLPAQMATHFGINGEPDGWSSRAVAVFGLPALMAGLNLILHFSTRADPKKANMSGALRTICFWLLPVLSVVCSALTLGIALGYPLSVERIIPPLVGVLFILVGNYLPKTKQSYTMGIKLPWTLHSEENWNRTHRLAGFVWVVSGAAFLLLTFLNLWSAWALTVILLIMVLVPGIYSYILYRKGV